MIHAVLNPEPDGIGFVVLDGNAVLADEHTDMYGRSAAALPVFVLEKLKALRLSLADVSRWSVGTGPGSFTALRMTAALVSGWCFGKKNAQCRGIPGAVALGAVAPPEYDRIGALYDGRNHEALYFGLKRENGEIVPTGETGVFDAGQAEAFFAGRAGEFFICHAHDAEAVRKIVPPGISVTAAPKPDAAALARNSTFVFDNDLTRLVYIRPAVYGH